MQESQGVGILSRVETSVRWPLIDVGGWGDSISADSVDWFVNADPCVDTHMAEFASITSDMLRQFIDDGFTSGHNPNDVAADDDLWIDGETARLVGEQVATINHYMAAANKANP